MKKFQAIVIGGGISGLTACSSLIEKGIHNVILLEADNRLGGRIKTIDYENSFLELGAQWIHGQKKNPIYEICKSLDLTDEAELETDTFLYSTQDGSSIDEDYVEKYYEKFEDMFEEIEEKIEDELEDSSKQSLGKLVDDGFKKFLRKLKPKEHNNIELLKSIFRFRVYEERSDNVCDDIYQLNAVGWNEYEYLEGDYLTRTKYGFGKLVEYFSSKIPEGLIKLNEKVINIDWSSDKVKVSAVNSMTNQKTIYEADYVLCTIPLGYLKRSMYDLFYPSLPDAKIDAIQNLGFGTANKIFVAFDKPVLDKNVEALQILWRTDLSDNILDESIVKKWNLGEKNKFYKSLDNFMVLPNLPNVLLIFIVAQDAIFIENLEEECLKDIINELLTKCFPKLNLPKPKRILKSAWNRNEYSRGSYTYVRASSTVNDIKILSQPLENKVFFSGEATTSRYIGTVHGAHYTGIKAATQIANRISDE